MSQLDEYIGLLPTGEKRGRYSMEPRLSSERIPGNRLERAGKEEACPLIRHKRGKHER
jgi:hypothetical protein